MEIICLQDDAFYALIERVVTHIRATQGIKDVNE